MKTSCENKPIPSPPQGQQKSLALLADAKRVGNSLKGRNFKKRRARITTVRRNLFLKEREEEHVGKRGEPP